MQLKEQLGWQGMAGLAMLVIAGLFHVFALQPVEQEVAYMHSRLDAAQSRMNGHGELRIGDQQKELGAFFGSLPGEEDVTDILGSVMAIAEASKVDLKQAEYRVSEKTDFRMAYSLYLPAQGGYSNIRHFVFRVLAEHPAIALDQINFQREKVNDPTLKAEVRLTLFIRSKP